MSRLQRRWRYPHNRLWFHVYTQHLLSRCPQNINRLRCPYSKSRYKLLLSQCQRQPSWEIIWTNLNSCITSIRHGGIIWSWDNLEDITGLTLEFIFVSIQSRVTTHATLNSHSADRQNWKHLKRLRPAFFHPLTPTTTCDPCSAKHPLVGTERL